MNSKEASLLKPGQRIRFTQNRTELESCLPPVFAGKEAEVVRNDPGNERLFFKMTRDEARAAGIPDYDWTALEKGDYYAYYTCIACVVKKGQKTKVERFSKKDVESYCKQGSNDRLKAELSSRIAAARRELETAPKPETFKSQLLKAGEQLRQAHLIHHAIK